MVSRLEIALKKDLKDAEGAGIAQKAIDYFGFPVEDIRVIRVLTMDTSLDEDALELARTRIFTNAVIEESSFYPMAEGFDWLIWVGLRPGVRDTAGSTAVEAMEDLLGEKIQEGEAVYTSRLYSIKGALSEDQATDNFPIVQHCVADEADLSLQVKMYTGGGDWVLQRYAMEGRRGADQLELLHGLYSKRLVTGAEPTGELRRYHMRSSEEKTITLEMDPEWCYVPLAVSVGIAMLASIFVAFCWIPVALRGPAEKEMRDTQAADDEFGLAGWRMLWRWAVGAANYSADFANVHNVGINGPAPPGVNTCILPPPPIPALGPHALWLVPATLLAIAAIALGRERTVRSCARIIR